MTQHDPQTSTDPELGRRLDRLEQPGGGGMLQPALPWTDLALVTAVAAAVSALLLAWAR